MRVNGQAQRTLWWDAREDAVKIIDQTRLPHHFETRALRTLDDACLAITHMHVRGAPLIGVTAAFGVMLALREGQRDLDAVCAQLLATRPTAVNLAWALQRMKTVLQATPPEARAEVAFVLAQLLAEEDVAACSAIGQHGFGLLHSAWQKKKAEQPDAKVLNVLTHCNAGWLATVDWGTALAPLYKAHLAGIPLHVWVDETRPRNQGAFLTAWELQQEGIDHTVIVDNAGGHLMQHGEVDLCLVGSDRTTRRGDVCNKIGTYLKALAAYDNHVPFYVALPVSTIDFTLEDGVREIPIEQRHAHEVSHMQGLDDQGEMRRVQVMSAQSAVNNYGFDVTPARLVTALITERGVYPANEAALRGLANL